MTLRRRLVQPQGQAGEQAHHHNTSCSYESLQPTAHAQGTPALDLHKPGSDPSAAQTLGLGPVWQQQLISCGLPVFHVVADWPANPHSVQVRFKAGLQG